MYKESATSVEDLSTSVCTCLPVCLQTVPIIIGLVYLLFGIIMETHTDKLTVYSGVFVWRPAMLSLPNR